MSELQNFQFLRPYWLLVLIPLLGAVVFLLKHKLFSRSWQAVCDAKLLPHILIGQEAHTARWPVYLFAFAGLLLIVAAAGPVWKKLPQPVYQTKAALILVLDLSQSMDATDIRPSRITRAKHKISDILAKRTEGQTALVVYASEAFVVSPLSDDVKTIESMVTSLSTDLMPRQGSEPALAVEKATQLLHQGGMRNGDILLITDGLGSNDEKDILSKLRGKNYRLSVLAVGTPGGAPVQLSDGSLLKDRQGDIVIPKLQDQPLRSLANSSGGRFTVLTTTDKDINYLMRGFEFSPVTGNMEIQTQKLNRDADTWREEGPWLLLLVAPLVALGFRRGWLSVVIICLMLPVSRPTYAFSWADLWQNQDQRAQKALENGKPEQAAQQFDNPQWKAAANYKAKNYEKTLELLANSQDPEDMYNKANALARLGRLQDAIKAYDEVLKANPENQDAQYNKALLQKYMKQQKNQKGDSKNSKNNNDKNQQQQDSQNQQSQQDKQGQQSQSQNGDKSQQQSADNQQAQQDQQSSQQQSQQQKDSQSKSQQDKAGDDQQKPSPENAQQAQQQAQDQQAKQDDEQKSAQDASQQQDKNKQEGKEQRYAQKAQESDAKESETMQATEQWLRRIPDDPGGLLRRKFLYQSQANPQQRTNDDEPW